MSFDWQELLAAVFCYGYWGVGYEVLSFCAFPLCFSFEYSSGAFIVGVLQSFLFLDSGHACYHVLIGLFLQPCVSLIAGLVLSLVSNIHWTTFSNGEL